jgi:hypothetical protein
VEGLVREKLSLCQHPCKECCQVQGDGVVAQDVEGGEHGQAGEGGVVGTTLLRIIL